MKGDIHSFHMRYRGLISIHRLHRKINFGPLTFLPLVYDMMLVVTDAESWVLLHCFSFLALSLDVTAFLANANIVDIY